jgi:hypothetical protein
MKELGEAKAASLRAGFVGLGATGFIVNRAPVTAAPARGLPSWNPEPATWNH